MAVEYLWVGFGGLLAASTALGVATRKNWRALRLGPPSLRAPVQWIGWGLLAVSTAVFVIAMGWEIGLSWGLLLLGPAALIVTGILSLRKA